MSHREFFKKIVKENETYISEVNGVITPLKSIFAQNTLLLPHIVSPANKCHLPQVQCWNMDTLDAAYLIQRECPNQRCLVLNMASDRTPGGGYLNGALAQEESLFYRTTLSHVIPIHHYPLGVFSAIYSPQVVVFRDSRYNVLEYDQCFKVDILSMAAVRFRTLKDYDIMEQKIHGLCRAAQNLKYNVLLLGAFGCGAFRNDPHVVSKLFKQILPQYNFQKVYFAIIGDNDNFRVFQTTFGADGK